MSSRPTRVLMIGIDAAEPRLVESWMDDGTLPGLARLRDRGAYGRLESSARWFAGSVWPTFFTGMTPADHGVFHHLQWRGDRMGHLRPDPEWVPATPFWRPLSAAGPRVVALDVPMVYPPEPFNGVEISGWATHDRLAPPQSSPPALMQWLEEQFGPPHMTKEGSSHRKPQALVRLRDELIEATRLLGNAGVALMQREPWDLFLCGFGATHRGGHLLWGLPDSHGGVPAQYRDTLRGALRDVYAECDSAVGRLVDAAGEGTTVLVFSLHGMGPNTSRAETVLPKMLARVLAGERPEKVKEQASALEALRRRIPVEWRSSIRRRLPTSWQDRLAAFWRTGGIDWAVTRAMCQVADAQGYIRVNLKGREAAGIVDPGEEYDALCTEIQDGLATFSDADTGESLVKEVARVDRVFAEGDRRHHLPDLLVRWSDTPASTHRRIVSPRFGEFDWPTPGGTPDGRSGNHRDEGILVAAGEGIRERSAIDSGSILDLAPTVFDLFGVPRPEAMRGRPLPGLRG